MAEPLLSPAFLQALDRLRFTSRRPARGHLRGLHRSARKGSGMEFVDYRPYNEGDDLKSVDWRTYMRLDRLIVRLFVEEVDLPIYVFLDTSASMGFGQPSKFDQARKIAAALAHVGFINMDRVSLVAITNQVTKDLSNVRGKDQSWPAFQFLDGLQAGGKTDLAQALKRYFAVPRPRGLAILISDFLDGEGFEPVLAVLRNRRQDVLVVHVTNQADQLLAAGEEEVVLVDAETGSEIRQRITPKLLADYARAEEQYGEEIAQYCAKHDWGYVQARTDFPFEDVVLRALRKEGLLR